MDSYNKSYLRRHSLFTKTFFELNLNINCAEWRATIFQHVTKKTRNSKQLNSSEKPRIKGQPLKNFVLKEDCTLLSLYLKSGGKTPDWKTACKRKTSI